MHIDKIIYLLGKNICHLKKIGKKKKPDTVGIILITLITSVLR